MVNNITGHYVYIVTYEADIKREGEVVRDSIDWKFASAREAYAKYDELKTAWLEGKAGRNVCVELTQRVELETTLAWFA